MILIWVKIVVSLVFVVLPTWLGSKVGIRYRKALQGEVDHTPLGSVVGAALGLLAFMLAFTFQLTSNRFDNRKQLMMDEVSAIRTTYLRAALLKDTDRIKVRRLIREYVDLRAQPPSADQVDEVVKHSKEIQDSLWLQAVHLAEEDRSSEVYALFTSSLNDMIDLHNKRLATTIYYRIPDIVLWILFFIAFFSMLILGFQFGVSGKTNLLVVVSLAIVFSAVMWLIFALDDAKLGLITVDYQQVQQLQREVHTTP